MLGIFPSFFKTKNSTWTFNTIKKTIQPALSKYESAHIRLKCFEMYGLVQSIIKIYGALPTPRMWPAPTLLHIHGLVEKEQHRHRQGWCDGQRPRWNADTKGPQKQNKHHFLTAPLPSTQTVCFQHQGIRLQHRKYCM